MPVTDQIITEETLVLWVYPSYNASPQDFLIMYTFYFRGGIALKTNFRELVSKVSK